MCFRSNLIASIFLFGTTLNAEQTLEKLVLPSSILEIEGDLAYGEYLASDCQTCHRSDNSNQGIPGINGREIIEIVYALHEYKNKYRKNQVMQMMAGGLGDDEIAALASYFASLQ
jgi:cytochrome c